MALTFPISASIGQTYQSGSSNTYEWTGTYWKIKNITTANFVGKTQYQIDSASFLEKIAQGTNEQDLSYLATTGSNTFIGNQILTGSGLSLLNLRGDSQNPWALTIANDTFNLNSYGNTDSSSFQFGAYVWNDGRVALGALQDSGLELSSNAQYYNPQLIISSSGVKINKDTTISGSILVSGSIIPTTADGTYTSSFSLGSATNAWKDLYISHGSIIFVDAVTQATSSFSITTEGGVGENTVKYTAAITASQYLGDGGNLTNLPSATNWNKNKMYTVTEGEQLTFSGDYILENSYLQILGVPPSEWITVNRFAGSGPSMGTITKTGDTTYYISGPNDDDGSEMIYMKGYFENETTLTIPYVWNNMDSGEDWPIWATSSIEPGNSYIPYTNRLEVSNAQHEEGTWTVTVPANNWFAIGTYTTDSCCGSGSLQIQLPALENKGIEYSPGKYFKKEGSIFIGGNLLLKDSTILNNGKISVGGEVILIGDSQITGTGTII